MLPIINSCSFFTMIQDEFSTCDAGKCQNQRLLQSIDQERLEAILDNSTPITFWSEFFYKYLDEIGDTFQKKHKDMELANFKEAYSQKIEKRYQSMKHNWEQYLLSPKKAFLRYVEHRLKI